MSRNRGKKQKQHESKMSSRRATIAANLIDAMYERLMLGVLYKLGFHKWSSYPVPNKDSTLWENLMLEYEEYKDLPPLCDTHFDPDDFS